LASYRAWFICIGIASGSWHSFPYAPLRSAYHYVRPVSPSPPPVPPSPLKLLAAPRTWDEETLLKARAELRSWLVPTIDVRTELLNDSFLASLGQEERGEAEKILSGVRASVISGAFAEIKRWRWRALHLQNGGRKLLIIHRGHEQNAFKGNIITLGLKAGYDVIVMTMPMFDWNAMNSVEFETWDGASLLSSPTDHAVFEMIDTGDRHYIGFFISPVIAAIDAALSVKHYESVDMVGFSGGGWTASITAAADERIGSAISVAGTLPFFARQQAKDLGDDEQYDNRFYRRFTWPMLYQMAATPKGRNFILAFNSDDPCCFNGASAQLFAEYAKNLGYLVKITHREDHSFDSSEVIKWLLDRSRIAKVSIAQ